MRTHKNTKQFVMTLNRPHVSCQTVIYFNKQTVAQTTPSVILHTASSQSGQFAGSVALRLRIKRILYYSVLRIQIRSWQWKRTLSITTHVCCNAGVPVVLQHICMTRTQLRDVNQGVEFPTMKLQF
jgi:hypothetical protein